MSPNGEIINRENNNIYHSENYKRNNVISSQKGPSRSEGNFLSSK